MAPKFAQLWVWAPTVTKLACLTTRGKQPTSTKILKSVNRAFIAIVSLSEQRLSRRSPGSFHCPTGAVQIEVGSVHGRRWFRPAWKVPLNHPCEDAIRIGKGVTVAVIPPDRSIFKVDYIHADVELRDLREGASHP